MKFRSIGRGHSGMLERPDIALPALETVLSGLELSIAEISHIGSVRQQIDSSKYASQLEPIFRILALSTKPLTHGLFSELSHRTTLNVRSLEDWKRHLLKDPTWRPYQTIRMNRRTFTNADESHLAEFLRKKLFVHINIVRRASLT
jgi:hypothetical protein